LKKGFQAPDKLYPQKHPYAGEERETMKPPVVYFEMVFIGFFLFFGYSMLRSFLPLFAMDLDSTGVLVGFSISSYFFARLFIELPSGIIADRIGRRTPILIGLCLVIIGTITCAFSKSIYILILGLTLWGLGTAFFFTSSIAYMIDLFEPHMRGRALGTFQGVESVGLFAGVPIGGFLAEYFNYTSVFYVASALIAICFFVAFESKGLKQVNFWPTRRSTSISIRKDLKELKNWGLFVTCMASLSRMFIGQGIISTILPIYLHEFRNMSIGLVGIVVGIRTGGLCLTSLGCGYISDKVGRKSVIFTGIVIESLCIYFYTLASSFELLLLLAFVEGLGAGMIFAALIALVSEQATPGSTGSAVGVYRTFIDIGAVTGPVLLMMIRTMFGIYACFPFGAILLLVNILPLSTVKESRL